MNCEKFEFFGYETRDECLHEQENYDLTTITGQTNPINDGNTGRMLGIIIFSIIALCGFILGAGYLIRYLIIRRIIERYASAMSRRFPQTSQSKKPKSLKQLLKNIRLDGSDLEKNLSKIRKIFVKTESEADLEAGDVKVSNIFSNYFCLCKFHITSYF